MPQILRELFQNSLCPDHAHLLLFLCVCLYLKPPCRLYFPSSPSLTVSYFGSVPTASIFLDFIPFVSLIGVPSLFVSASASVTFCASHGLFHSIYIYCLHCYILLSAPHALFPILQHSLHPSLVYYFSAYVVTSTESLSTRPAWWGTSRRPESLLTCFYQGLRTFYQQKVIPASITSKATFLQR